MLEVIAFNIESCVRIEQAGAHRIELCDNPGEGGTTPSYGLIKKAVEAVNIPVFPIIRPRGGDFLYSDDEMEIIANDILMCKKLGCAGVVVGMLKTDGSVDKERMKYLVQLAYPMEVTFHRAFDRTNDLFTALEDVIETGCTRILTSGGYPTAMEGLENIKQLIAQANERIVIMPGSGIRAENIAELAVNTGATEFHSSARTVIASKMLYQKPEMKDDLKSATVNVDEVKMLLSNLKQVNDA